MNLARAYEQTAEISLHRTQSDFSFMILEPEELSDAVKAADVMREGNCVLLNTETLSPELKARMVDFLRGFAYVTDASMVQASSDLIFMAPYQVVVEYDAEDELRKE